jgi:hypothetical protein
MRPISQTTTQKLSHCRRDDATLYASLELSQATWLVSSLLRYCSQIPSVVGRTISAGYYGNPSYFNNLPCYHCGFHR